MRNTDWSSAIQLSLNSTVPSGGHIACLISFLGILSSLSKCKRNCFYKVCILSLIISKLDLMKIIVSHTCQLVSKEFVMFRANFWKLMLCVCIKIWQLWLNLVRFIIGRHHWIVSVEKGESFENQDHITIYMYNVSPSDGE